MAEIPSLKETLKIPSFIPSTLNAGPLSVPPRPCNKKFKIFIGQPRSHPPQSHFPPDFHLSVRLAVSAAGPPWTPAAKTTTVVGDDSLAAAGKRKNLSPHPPPGSSSRRRTIPAASSRLVSSLPVTDSSGSSVS